MWGLLSLDVVVRGLLGYDVGLLLVDGVVSGC